MTDQLLPRASLHRFRDVLDEAKDRSLFGVLYRLRSEWDLWGEWRFSLSCRFRY